ncbi:hypothetical protein [Actinomadura fulvescens]|uniref:hypothetical protein n=1 Tax=Actinomadura fulvescens TaxID=46160 RepID=UPI0031CF5277
MVWGLVMLCLAAMLVYQHSPWHRSWWPGRHEASRLPSACTAVTRAVVERAVPDAGPGKAEDHTDSSLYTLRTSCTWTHIAESRTGRLKIEYELHRMVATDGGIEVAKDAFRRHEGVYQRANKQGQRPVDRLGDEAFVNDTGRIKHLAVRRANVLVLVTYEVPLDRKGKAQPTVDLDAIGQTAIGKVHLDS